MLRVDISQLSTDEKITLVEKIWDSIEQDTAIRLTKQQKKLLADREEQIVSGKVKTLTWQQLKKGLKRK